MKIVDEGFKILSEISEGGLREIKLIERAARVCYKSEDKITEDGESAKKMIRGLIKRHHFAMLEHSSLTVLFRVNRGVTHELVRHRVASFAQESTRYCNYHSDKNDNSIIITDIQPAIFQSEAFMNLQQDVKDHILDIWRGAQEYSEKAYLEMTEAGCPPQFARDVLTQSTKAEIVVTANYREWRHILNLRAIGTTGAPHPEIQQVMIPLLNELKRRIPVVFDDLGIPEELNNLQIPFKLVTYPNDEWVEINASWSQDADNISVCTSMITMSKDDFAKYGKRVVSTFLHMVCKQGVNDINEFDYMVSYFTYKELKKRMGFTSISEIHVSIPSSSGKSDDWQELMDYIPLDLYEDEIYAPAGLSVYYNKNGIKYPLDMRDIVAEEPLNVRVMKTV